MFCVDDGVFEVQVCSFIPSQAHSGLIASVSVEEEKRRKMLKCNLTYFSPIRCELT